MADLQKLRNVQNLRCKRHDVLQKLKPIWINNFQILMMCEFESCSFPLDETDISNYIIDIPDSLKCNSLNDLKIRMRKINGKVEKYVQEIEHLLPSRYLFLPLKCWCNCILSILALSISNISISVKLNNSLNGDYQLIKCIHQYIQNLNYDNKCTFCTDLDQSAIVSPATTISNIFSFISNKNSEYSQPNSDSIFNFINVDQLITFYCSSCKFQQILEKQSAPLIITSRCISFTSEYIKSYWSCSKCFDSNAICEIKYKLSESSSIFIVFTKTGLSNLSILKYTPTKETDTYLLINGRFVVKYLVVEDDEKIRIIPSNSKDTFSAESVRAIVWHHTNPSSRLCNSTIKQKEIFQLNSKITQIKPQGCKKAFSFNKFPMTQKKKNNVKKISDFEGYKSSKLLNAGELNEEKSKTVENIYISTDNNAFSEIDQYLIDLDSSLFF